MLKEQQKHGEYIQFVKTWLQIVYPHGPPPIHAHVATMIMVVDLTPMRKIVEHLYSVLGRPARIPVPMLRSLIVMEEAYGRDFSLKYASFDSASDAYGISVYQTLGCWPNHPNQ